MDFYELALLPDRKRQKMIIEISNNVTLAAALSSVNIKMRKKWYDAMSAFRKTIVQEEMKRYFSDKEIKNAQNEFSRVASSLFK